MKDNFTFMRERYAGFCVYLVKGRPGEVSRPHVPIIEPTPRAMYPNAQAVIKGYLDCEGPDGKVVRFEEGMVDVELPGYEVPGQYIFRPGPQGVQYFCIARCPAYHVALRQVIRMENGASRFILDGHIFALVTGKLKVNEREYPAPLIVDCTEETKIITAVGPAKGMELWV